MIWLWLSAGAMVIAAFVHSVLGARRLLAPLLEARHGILGDDQPRRVVRFAWHATSVLMLVSAAAVAWPGTPRSLISLIGGAWLATGLFNAAYTRGRHIAWPVLSAAGVLALIGAMA